MVPMVVIILKSIFLFIYLFTLFFEFKISIKKFVVCLDLLSKIGFNIGKTCDLVFELLVHLVCLGNGCFKIMDTLIEIPLFTVLIVGEDRLMR